MRKSLLTLLALGLLASVFACHSILAATMECDLSEYQRSAGVSAEVEGDTLVVSWEGERDTKLRIRFSLNEGRPTIQEFAVRKNVNPWNVLGRNLAPVFTVTAGVRRTGHDLPEANRWEFFWDAPLQHPDEVRQWSASFHSSGCRVHSNGSRLEVSFPGVSMGIFSGHLQYTVYRGSNLVRQEVIAKTDQPSVAY